MATLRAELIALTEDDPSTSPGGPSVVALELGGRTDDLWVCIDEMSRLPAETVAAR
ncbi:MAG: hypothetical protein ACRD2C_00805 [Acidimicrobiales bacterium]